MTHIVLGACIGEVFLGKRIGKRSMLLGALSQSLPDVDFMAALWTDPASNLLAHRGFTHSLLFAAIMTYFLALLADHYHKKHKIPYRLWYFFFGAELAAHLFTDVFNSYGIGLLEPFSHQRFSLNALFVADPFFSVWPAIASVALLILPRWSGKRKAWAWAGIGISASYLIYCVSNKINIDRELHKELAAHHMVYQSYMTTPTPLNNWLWYVIVKDRNGYYIGFRSVFDREVPYSFHYFFRNDSLLQAARNHEEVQKLLRFSQGYYTVEKEGSRLVFNDLRFGQIVGWYDPREAFVFHYYLMQTGKENAMVVQRGRFAGWNRQTMERLVERIRGEP